MIGLCCLFLVLAACCIRFRTTIALLLSQRIVSDAFLEIRLRFQWPFCLHVRSRRAAYTGVWMTKCLSVHRAPCESDGCRCRSSV